MDEFTQLFSGWSDTAVAIAIIVAVLLIPTSVIAWNYATYKEALTSNDIQVNSRVSESTPVVHENNAVEKMKSYYCVMDGEVIRLDLTGEL